MKFLGYYFNFTTY